MVTVLYFGFNYNTNIVNLKGDIYMIEKNYKIKNSSEKLIEKIVKDEILEFFVIKAPNPKFFGGK
jgi:hypothetical protein